MNNELPEGYIKWIERVSDVVSFLFPFKGEDKKRYIEWVYKSLSPNIKPTWDFDNQKARELIAEFPEFVWKYDIAHMVELEDLYIREAQDTWTAIHSAAETIMKADFTPSYDDKYDKILRKERLDYYSQVKEEGYTYIAEKVIRDKDNRFQGTIDLVQVEEETKTVWLYDWKTWWIAKERFNLPNNYRKPYSKLKKVALQLSLYAEYFRQKGYTIWWIYAVWLHHTWAYEYPLKLWTTDEINSLLEKFIKRDWLLPPNIDLIFKYNPMQIEINTPIPDNAYSNARVILEQNDIEKFPDPKKAIESAISLQKYLLSKY